MLNKNAQIDVYNGVNLINEAEIINKAQLKKFFENQGFKAKRIDSIINIILKNKLAYEVKDTDYITATPMISFDKFTQALNKAIWFYLDGSDPNPENDIYNFHCKYPAVLYTASKDKALDDLTCFYIPKGEEGSMCRIIDTNYNLFNSQVNTAIILDDVTQIEKINLPKNCFNIKFFAVIDNNGSVKYYTSD